MYLDSKYYSYFNKLGVMKENYSKEHAFMRLVEAIETDTGVHPEFTKKVKSLTIDSPEVSVRACMLYHYDLNVEYTVNGRQKTATVKEYNSGGLPDGIEITKLKGDGDCTIVSDFSSLPYTVYNDNNIFTKDEMEDALLSLIKGRVPSGTSNYGYRGSISAYAVPVMVIIIPFNGKDYQLSYNMHNGHYCWNNPDDPALLKKGKTAGMLAKLVRFAALALSVIGIILGIKGGFGGIVLPLILGIVQFFMWKKGKKEAKFFKKYFIKNPKHGMMGPLKHLIAPVIIGVLGIILGAVMGSAGGTASAVAIADIIATL